MILFIHQICGGCLLLVHSLFFCRGWFLVQKDVRPGKADRLLMALSQWLYPLMFFTALPLPFQGIQGAGVHLIPVFLPFISMLVLSRRSFRRKHPLVLPGINWLWIGLAFLSGVLL